jgi:hypothetical protein
LKTKLITRAASTKLSDRSPVVLQMGAFDRMALGRASHYSHGARTLAYQAQGSRSHCISIKERLLSGSPFERGLKRLRRRSAHDHNKAVVQGDTPVNTVATPVNVPAASPGGADGAGAAAPALIVVPHPTDYTDLAAALVAVVVWAFLTWRARRGEAPVT